MITEELIFYFVRKVYKELPKEWKVRLKNTRIVVQKETIEFSDIEEKPEVLGQYSSRNRYIEYFLPTLRNYIGGERDIYEALKKIESVVEHELLHAIGLNHNDIDKYRKGRKEYSSLTIKEKKAFNKWIEEMGKSKAEAWNVTYK